MLISVWSSVVCSSDLAVAGDGLVPTLRGFPSAVVTISHDVGFYPGRHYAQAESSQFAIPDFVLLLGGLRLVADHLSQLHFRLRAHAAPPWTCVAAGPPRVHRGRTVRLTRSPCSIGHHMLKQ